MSRMTPFSSPLLLGFDAMEKTLERLAKSGDSYPPYNIERLSGADGKAERLRIT
ncbi:MAG: heat-shock protein Hsp20, partial [Mesorhizobium sp.]